MIDALKLEVISKSEAIKTQIIRIEIQLLERRIGQLRPMIIIDVPVEPPKEAFTRLRQRADDAADGFLAAPEGPFGDRPYRAELGAASADR